jgi:hypothetical protein
MFRGLAWRRPRLQLGRDERSTFTRLGPTWATAQGPIGIRDVSLPASASTGARSRDVSPGTR